MVDCWNYLGYGNSRHPQNLTVSFDPPPALLNLIWAKARASRWDKIMLSQENRRRKKFLVVKVDSNRIRRSPLHRFTIFRSHAPHNRTISCTDVEFFAASLHFQQNKMSCILHGKSLRLNEVHTKFLHFQTRDQTLVFSHDNANELL